MINWRNKQCRPAWSSLNNPIIDKLDRIDWKSWGWLSTNLFNVMAICQFHFWWACILHFCHIVIDHDMNITTQWYCISQRHCINHWETLFSIHRKVIVFISPSLWNWRNNSKPLRQIFDCWLWFRNDILKLWVTVKFNHIIFKNTNQFV